MSENETFDDVEDANVVEFDTTPDTPDQVDDPTLWDALSNDEEDVNTMIWYTDLSFPVVVEEQDSIVREVFAATNKQKVVNRIYQVVSSPDVAEACEFDASDYTTKVSAVQAFFDGVEDRNLFIGLVPVV